METLTSFQVPIRTEVSATDQGIFDKLEGMLGKVPNLYATFALNPTALGDYLTLQNRKSTLSGKEREIINLVVSEYNNCAYCVPAHTVLAGMQGFTPEQILNIRTAQYPENEKYHALAQLALALVQSRGLNAQEELENFLAVGYTQANVIDVLMTVGDKIISNYLHSLTQIPVDWPAVPSVK